MDDPCSDREPEKSPGLQPAAPIQGGKRRPSPSLRKAADVMCWRCTSGWGDGRVDCEDVDCPLYSWHRVRKLKPNLWWTQINPRRKYSDADYEATVRLKNEMRGK